MRRCRCRFTTASAQKIEETSRGGAYSNTELPCFHQMIKPGRDSQRAVNPWGGRFRISDSGPQVVSVHETRSRRWNAINHFFCISARGSSITIELVAGLSVYLSVAYIFIVNPAILSTAGFDRDLSFFATVIISAVATLAMGLWARLPFVVSTGMEMNGYIAFFVVGTLAFTWQDALGMVFWSGVAMTLVTLTSWRERIIDSIPDALKIGLSFSVGVFLVLIAFRVSGIIVYDGLAIAGLGSFTGPPAIALYFCLICIALLKLARVTGSFLIAILLSAMLLQAIGQGTASATPMFANPRWADGIGALDLTIILNPHALSVVLVLFVLDFFGSIAKIIALSRETSMLDDNGRLPRRKEALLVDGAGTMTAAFLGTTSVVVFVESAVGIIAGGRTGLAAIVCGLLMLLTLVAFPLVQFIPVAATAGVIVFVGLGLCPRLHEVRKFPWYDRVALASMPIITIATFSLDRAMLAGFAISAAGQAGATRRMPNAFFAVSIALLAAGVILQVVQL
jgi:adenine/guanine/hypoxanthine permease